MFNFSQLIKSMFVWLTSTRLIIAVVNTTKIYIKFISKNKFKTFAFFFFLFIVIVMKIIIGVMLLPWYLYIVKYLLYSFLLSLVYFTKRELFDSIDGDTDVSLVKSFNFRWKYLLVKCILIILLTSVYIDTITTLIVVIAVIFDIDVVHYMFGVIYLDSLYTMSKSAFERMCIDKRREISNEARSLYTIYDTIRAHRLRYKCKPIISDGPTLNMDIIPEKGFNENDTLSAKNAFVTTYIQHLETNLRISKLKRELLEDIDRTQLIDSHWSSSRSNNWKEELKDKEVNKIRTLDSIYDNIHKKFWSNLVIRSQSDQ